MHAKQPTKKGLKAAARKQRAASSPLSPTARVICVTIEQSYNRV
jgi:hypothetical protein